MKAITILIFMAVISVKSIEETEHEEEVEEVCKTSADCEDKGGDGIQELCCGRM